MEQLEQAEQMRKHRADASQAELHSTDCLDECFRTPGSGLVTAQIIRGLRACGTDSAAGFDYGLGSGKRRRDSIRLRTQAGGQARKTTGKH
jgi:hypothetical protein